MISRQQLKKLCQEAQQMGAKDAVIVSPRKEVFTATWVRLRCQYGCSEYGQCLTCPPHAPTPETTRRLLDEYQAGLLLHGHDWKALRKIAQTLYGRWIGRLFDAAFLLISSSRSHRARATPSRCGRTICRR